MKFLLIWNGHEIGIGSRGQLLEYVESTYVKQGFEKVALDRWRRGSDEVRLVPKKDTGVGGR